MTSARSARRDATAKAARVQFLGPEWADPAYDPGKQYSMPYVWWTTGIGYDTRRVEEVPTRSNVLWDPRYENHISLMDDYQETMGLTLIQKGFSANTTIRSPGAPLRTPASPMPRNVM